MKKILTILTTIILTLTLAGCGKEEVIEVKETKVSANGYGGEIVLNVSTKGQDLTNIEVVSHHETDPIFNRAFPLIKERMLSNNSPIVDNVIGATYTSFACKKAVGDALREVGNDFGEIKIDTEPVHEPKQLEDVDTDIVIVGGGAAGLSAALTAKENGANKVILVEKQDFLSGNSMLGMNFYGLLQSKVTEEAGTNFDKDSVISFLDSKFGNEKRINRWIENNYVLDDWFRSMNITLDYTYGLSNHMKSETEYAGDHIQTGLEQALAKTDVDVRTGTKGVDLVMKDGTATGVKVETRDGNYTINAKAVIIATGGFSANKELLEKYVPDYNGFKMTEFVNTSLDSTTGDFLPVFYKNNIRFLYLPKVNIYDSVLKENKIITGGASVSVRVNKDGKFSYDTPNTSFYITNKDGYDSFYRIRKHVEEGYYKQANTLEELANTLGVNYENLLEAIDVYNTYLRQDGQIEFDINKGPFYGAEVVAGITTTKGGVVANYNAEVLDNHDNIVKGLYAAGEVTATLGEHNAAVIFGRIAGEEATKYVLNK